MLLNKKRLWLITIIILILVSFSIMTGQGPVYTLAQKIFSRPPVWYAVHLNNTQVYFGQIKSIKKDTLTLTHTYYLESYTAATNQNTISTSKNFQLQPAATPQKTWQLVKQGGDTTLTTDQTIIINRSAIIFWEKMDSSSEVAKLITGGMNR